MDLSRTILGPVVTEKAEAGKMRPRKTYTLRVAPHANKVDVKNALKKFYAVEVAAVRIMRVGPKYRPFGRNQVMRKRDPYKKAIITLAEKSKPLDLSSFTAS